MSAAPVVHIVVPPRFWDDHSDRAPSDYSDGRDICVETSRTKSKVWLKCNPEALANLRNDAEHYAHRWGPDECPAGIKSSARATLKAIEKATAVGSAS